MNRLTQDISRTGRSAFRSLAWIAGAVAWSAAAALGAVMAVFLAAAMVAVALMGSLFLTLAGAAMKARRTVRAPADPQLIEARRVGGHSWVAYGWDGRS
jgi:uncharacterized membrane protein